ncbi:hypothetical protein GGR54DRAFT_649523 [Hypoxylon sp. NC1633]|nr:hypothetical protein GGR54DRAFT_649523 [Hypoxylon sp. NC1633]
MSHIPTTPVMGKTGFDALPQSHAANADLAEFNERRYEYGSHTNRAHGRQYNQVPSDSFQGEDLPEYGGGGEPSLHLRTDYTRVSTSYKPDMITYGEAALETPPMIDRERPNYKPSALRWPFLSILLLVILTLAGLIAWALHVLPVLDNKFDILDDIRGRGVASIEHPGNRPVFSAPLITARNESIAKSEPVGTMTPAEGNFGHVGAKSVTETVGTMTPAKSDFGHVGVQSVTEPAGPSTTPPPTTSSTSTSVSLAFSKPESDFGKVGGPVTISETIASSKAQGDFGNVGIHSVTETIPASEHGDVGTVTVSEAAPQTPTVVTPTFVTPEVTVLTDSEGVATTTSTNIPEPVSTPLTTTLTDSQGKPTATQETHVLVTPSITVQTDLNGQPTATATFYPVVPPDPNPKSDNDDDNDNSDGNVVVKEYTLSYGQYFIGMFLPTLLAIIIAIPVRILDLNAKILQPWHELTDERGSPGRASLCLDTSGWQSVVASWRSLLGGQALVFLTSALALAAALLIPVSAEAVAFDLRGVGCVQGGGSGRNCAYVLSVFDQAAKATLALLAVMGVAVVMIIVVLVRWESGVSTNPWSICGTASLALNSDVRRLFTSLPAGVDAGRMPKGLLESVLEERWFRLGYFYGPNGTVEYGIMLGDGNGGGYTGQVGGEVKEPQDHHAAPTKAKHHLPFLMLGWVGRSVLLFVLCSLLSLILYYNNTGGDTPFERFMDSESFGVRFLFTGVGVIISFFWASFFSSIAVLSPYQLLSSSPQHARRSILLAPPTNAFSGLWSSMRRRHFFLGVVALISILSEFLTIFLSNIPFRVTQTFLAHQVCTWAAVGILCVMVLVVVGSFFVMWPHMPVDPSTIAGAMYYVCDSWMLSRLEGLSTSRRRDRDWLVNEMGLRYEFGEIRGASGIVRIGVDASSSSGAL